MTDFFPFPDTPYLAWLGPSQLREEKVLDARQVREFLSRDVFIEEEVDGPNLGLSVDDKGVLLAQNRGKHVKLDAPARHWKPLKRWLSNRKQALVETLAPGLILFGEWRYAAHSVHYTRLPDWFLAFGVYRRSQREFLGVERRNAVVSSIERRVVPALGHARFDLEGVKALMAHSCLTDGPPDGVYVRREADGHRIERTKLVRPELVQAIGEDWSKRNLEENQLMRTGP
ncbi:MAG: RNA ligase family protein [Myxococcota bacterium]